MGSGQLNPSLDKPPAGAIRKARRLCACLLLSWVASACQEPDANRTWELASQGIYDGAFSTTADLVVIGSLNHGASLWRTLENERLYTWSHEAGQTLELTAASISPDGSRAVTADARTLVLWDTSSGQALQYWATPGKVLDAAVFNDNRHTLLGLDDHSALLFDAFTGAYQQTLLHKGEVGAVSLSRDGSMALTGSDDETAKLWRLNDGAELQSFAHGNPVRAVVLSPRGTYSFTAAQGDLVALWDNANGNRLHTLHQDLYHGVVCAAFSEDETLLAVGYADRRISLFSVATGTELHTWRPTTRHRWRATGAAILAVGFHGSINALLALTGDGRLLELRRS